MEVVDFLFTNMGFGRRRPAVLILIKNFTKGKKKKTVASFRNEGYGGDNYLNG